MKIFHEKLITTWFPIVTILLVSILVFLPTLCHHHYVFNGDRLNDSINCSQHLHILTIAIGTSIPMLLEILMDYKDFPLNILIPKFFIACGLLIPNTIFLISNRTSITLFLNVVQSRTTLIAGGLLVSLFDSGNTWTHKITVCIITFTCATFMMISSWSLDDVQTKLSIILIIFNILCVLEALLISLWYSKRVILNWSDVMKSTTRKSTLIHAILISIYALSLIVISQIFGGKGWGQTGSKELVVYSSIDIVVAIIAITVPSRLVRKENYMIKHSLESKKHFVRYVSHEMRTPMNTVSVGLQLVEKYLLNFEKEINDLRSEPPSESNFSSFLEKINFMKDHSLNDLKSTIEDISISCTSSIDVLNDLLVYDQVEEGNLLLKQQYVKIIDYIKTISKPFKLLAIESGIHFTYLGNTNPSSPSHSISSSILGNDHTDNVDQDEINDLSDSIVWIDAFKFAQVIRNLLSNAFKYTPNGGSVKVSARVVVKDDTPVGENNSFIRIEIHDSGLGVPLENQSKLFSSIVSFHTENVENAQDGSGLGLYISTAIIRKHGGSIGVISSGLPGSGSIFYVDLPLVYDTDTKNLDDIRLFPSLYYDSKKVVPQNDILPSLSRSNSLPSSGTETRPISPTTPFPATTTTITTSAASATMTMTSSTIAISSTPLQNSAAAATVPSPSSPPPTLTSEMKLHFTCALVVDDSMMTRKMLVKSISNYFTTILQGCDGVEAVEIVKSQLEQGVIPNIIFLDSVMPNMSGIDACREIRSLGYHGVIVAVTGNVLPADIEEFLSAGADKLVPKPFKIDDIKTTLEEYYERICSPLSTYTTPVPISIFVVKDDDVNLNHIV